MKLLTGWINRQLFIALVKDTFVKSDDFSCFKGILIKDKDSLKLFHSAFITLPVARLFCPAANTNSV